MREHLEQLIAGLTVEAGLVAPALHPYRVSLKWMLAAAAYLALALALAGPRPDLGQALAQAWFGAEIVALLLIFVATAFSAALLAFPDLHQRRGLALAPLGAFALFLAVMAFAWRGDSPPAPPPPHTLQCTLDIALMSLLPAGWALFGLRRFASTHGPWAGVVAVLAAFSIGALWLRLHEATDSIAHVVAWHYLPMLAAALLGFWLGRRLLKW